MTTLRLRNFRANRTAARRAGFLALPVLALVALFASDVVAQTPARWVLADEYPATSLPGEGDAFFAKAVSDRTGSKLVIEPQPDAKSGFRSREQLKAVAEGKLAMADSFAGALGEEDPFFLLSSLPFLTPSASEARRLYDLARPRYEAVFERFNQKLLYSTPWPASGIWAKVPADTPQALAGLKIRTYDRTGTELMTALGATASIVSYSDLTEKFKSGAIDAVLSSGDGGAGRKLWEYLPHFTEINYAMPLSFTTVNLDAWKALDPATQRALLDAAAETEARQWQALDGRLAKNYARMRENGMTITGSISPELASRFRTAAEVAIADWQRKAGTEGSAVLERFRRN